MNAEEDKNTVNNPNPVEQNYQDMVDRDFGGSGHQSHTNKNADDPNEAPDLAAKEANAEKRHNPLANKENSPEKSWYNQNFANNASAFGRAKTAFQLASNQKKAAGAGGIIAIILGIAAFFTFLNTFQLIHMAEMAGNIFDAQSTRILNKRAAKHYSIIFDEDGKGYYKKNRTVTGRLGKAYAVTNPEKLVNALREKGYDLYIDDGGKLNLDGKPMTGKLSDQRNQITEILNKEYDNDGFIKRHARSRTAFKAFGIQRVFFFEETGRKIDNWQLEMIKRIRQRLGVNTGGSSVAINGDEDEETANKAKEIADETINNPESDPGANVDSILEDARNANVDLDTNKLGVVSGVTSHVGAAASLDGVAQMACSGKAYLKGIELSAVIIRHRALIANSAMLLIAAHQLKTGENVSGAQVGALMSLINKDPGIGASGSYQLMSGDTTAKVKNSDQYTLDFTKASGGAGVLAKFNKGFDDVLDATTLGQADSYCKIARTGWYQIGSAIVGLVVQVFAAIGTAGTSLFATGAKIAAQALLSVAIEIVKSVMQPIIAQNLAGPAAIIGYGASQTGDKTFDAFAAGALAESSGERYQNGMTQRLTKTQVASVESQIAMEKNDKIKTESVFEKYFALNNVDSALSKQLASMPSSAGAVTRSSTSALASLPATFAKSLGLFSPQGSAKAASIGANPYMTQNPLGIPMYGMSDDVYGEVDELDPVENENWIYAHGGLAEYQSWLNDCYPTDPTKSSMLYGLASTEEDYEKLNEKCTFGTGNKVEETNKNINSADRERYLRYSTYRMDRSIQQDALFMSDQTDCIDPDSEEWDCQNVSATTGNFRISTFNLLGAHHTASGGKLSGWESGAKRMDKAFEFLRSKNIQVVGFQEMEGEQHDRFVQLAGSSWSIYPAEENNTNNLSDNSIAWNNSVFELVDSGVQTDLQYFNGDRLDIPWVNLRYKSTNEVFHITNTHDPATTDGYSHQQKYRIHDAKIHQNDAITRINNGEKFIILGDFNSDGVVRDNFDDSNDRDDLTYCIMTTDSKLQNAYDMSHGISGNCPTRKRFSIDHIYAASTLTIRNWTKDGSMESAEVTDHSVVYADVMVAGAASTGANCSTVGVPDPGSDYSRVNVSGQTLNQRTKNMLDSAEQLYGSRLTVVQGSYNAGGVAASAGTHDGGGAIDFSVASMSNDQITNAVRALRQAGFAAWHRTPIPGVWGEHIHAIAIGDTEMSSGAAAQVRNYFDGKDGLSGGGVDTSLSTVGRPIPQWATAYGAAACPQ